MKTRYKTLLFVVFFTIKGCSKYSENGKGKEKIQPCSLKFDKTYISKDGSNYFDFPRADSVPKVFLKW